MANIIDYQAEIFQLYIVQNKTLDQVREILKLQKNLDVTRRILNTKLHKWGYLKTYRRSEHLAILRAKSSRDAEGKDSSFTLHGRPVQLKKVMRYQKRERLHPKNIRTIPTSNQGQSTDLVCRTPPPILPQSLPFIEHWRACEKFLYDSDILAKSSFEAGLWKPNGKNRLINSSPAQEDELTSLNFFLSNLRIGCAAADENHFDIAGTHWEWAFRTLGTLCCGQYHDILPNLIQQINDVNHLGYSPLASRLKEYMADMGKTRAQSHSLSSALISLGQIDLAYMTDVEQRLMKQFTELFELYLGPPCYNSFVMMMNTTRRKMLHNPWATFEDHLPSITQLDKEFGVSDRRSLDVIGLRLELLKQRGRYIEMEPVAHDFVERAFMIRNDNWQLFYQLTHGWFNLGCAQYLSMKYDFARSSFMNALENETELCKLNSFNIFEAQKADIQQYLTIIEMHSFAESADDNQC